MGMPCAHTIQPILADGDSLEPGHFMSQCRPGTRQQITDRSTRRVPSGFEDVEGVEAEVAGEAEAGREVEECLIR
ncbi:hypothetical protein V1506DRAFT_506754 [Lipomyces tetrasporus]